VLPMLKDARLVQADELANVVWFTASMFYKDSFDIEFVDECYAPLDLIIANSNNVFAMKSSIMFNVPNYDSPLVRILLIYNQWHSCCVHLCFPIFPIVI